MEIGQIGQSLVDRMEMADIAQNGVRGEICLAGNKFRFDFLG